MTALDSTGATPGDPPSRDQGVPRCSRTGDLRCRPRQHGLTLASQHPRTREGPVKTATSRRTLALPDACVDALERQIERQTRDRRHAGARWGRRLRSRVHYGTRRAPRPLERPPRSPSRGPGRLARPRPPAPPAPRSSTPALRGRRPHRRDRRHSRPPLHHRDGRGLPTPARSRENRAPGDDDCASGRTCCEPAETAGLINRSILERSTARLTDCESGPLDPVWLSPVVGSCL